jgi:F-type H+-transporting ATPase subunit c
MKVTRLALTSFAAMLGSAPMAFAQNAVTWENSFAGKGMAGLGAGLALIGAGWGFGRIGAAALESMARQPEVADKVSGSMITIAALLEGATFFALIVCLLILFIAIK